MILSKNILYFYMPRNKSKIYLHHLLLFHSAQVLVLESICLGLKYTLFYVNLDHLVVTKVDVKHYVNNTDVFQSFVTKKNYEINHKFDCDSKCLIYLFSCKTCGLQYVGSLLRDSTIDGIIIKTIKGKQHKWVHLHRDFFTNIF